MKDELRLFAIFALGVIGIMGSLSLLAFRDNPEFAIKGVSVALVCLMLQKALARPTTIKRKAKKWKTKTPPTNL